MNLDDYQKWTETTVAPSIRDGDYIKRLSYYRTKLVSEIGEICGKLGKEMRGDDVSAVDILQECGDVLWYAARLLDEDGLPMQVDASPRGIIETDAMMYRALIGDYEGMLGVLRKFVSRYDSTLEEVADLNHTKLTRRVERGTIQGDGDDR